MEGTDPIINTEAAATGGEQPADTLAQNEGQQQAAAETPWYNGLPADKHEALKDMSPEDAAAAIERGAAYKPVTSVDEIALDGVDMFPGESIANFKEMAVKSGMTAEQAAAQMEFYKAEKERLDSEWAKEQAASLRQEWGQAYDDNVKAANKAVVFLEGKLGGVKSAVDAGLHSNAAFVKIMAHIGKSISEADTSGGGTGGDGSQAIPPEQFYLQSHPNKN